MRTFKGQIGGSFDVTDADVVAPAAGGVGIGQDYGYAVQAIWVGADIAGTIKLQATIDGSTWSDLTGSVQSVSGPGSFLWNVSGAFYDQVRVYFTYASGSGSYTVWFENKGP